MAEKRCSRFTLTVAAPGSAFGHTDRIGAAEYHGLPPANSGEQLSSTPTREPSIGVRCPASGRCRPGRIRYGACDKRYRIFSDTEVRSCTRETSGWARFPLRRLSKIPQSRLDIGEGV